MAGNSELLKKADLALSDLSSGGSLNPEQSAMFIRKLIKEPTLLKQARIIEMLAPQRKINKIGFAQRILRAATSATALPQNGAGALGGRAKPTTSQISLNTKEVIAEVRLPYDVLEDNIERAQTADNGLPNTGPGGLRETLVSMIAERAALDVEELALLGDTAYTNGGDSDDQAYLTLVTGYIKNANANGHVVDNASATISKTMFKNGLKAMPPQFLRNRLAMRHFVSVNQETEYRDTLSDRVGQLGDSHVTGYNACFAYGVPVQPVALMPEAKGLFTNPLNFIVGVERNLSMEYDKDITSRVYIIVLTMRLDVQVEETDALIEYINIA
jgi:hypothetical protein